MTEVAGISISHPDRVVYPEPGLTKLDVARYYETIGNWMVPHVQGRPLTLVHCPEGTRSPCNFLKHSKLWGPKQLRRVKIPEKKKMGEDMIADTLPAYSTRARPGAPVSTPITWAELRTSLNPLSFTIETVPQRLSRRRSDPWKEYWTTRQTLTKTMVKAVS